MIKNIAQAVCNWWIGKRLSRGGDIYAKHAETIVNVEKPFNFPNNMGKTRTVGKSPALGYGYGTKGRRDEADTLGVVTHPHLHASLGFGMDEFPLTKPEDRPAQHHVERGNDHHSSSHDSGSSSSYDSGSSSGDSGGGGGGD